MSAQNTEQNNKKSKTPVIIIIGILIIIALLGVIIWLLSNDSDADGGSGSENEPRRNVIVNQENIDEVIDQIAENQFVVAGNYQVTMNSTWRFADGSSPSENAYVENVANNTNDVYFDLQLADTGEVILESPVIPRGSYMTDITLDKDLDAGTYNCVMTYHLIDEEQNTLSTLNMAVTLEIAN